MINSNIFIVDETNLEGIRDQSIDYVIIALILYEMES